MAKTKGVSSKTHTKKQLDDYANQHNPNNKAYRADQLNREKQNSENARQRKVGRYDVGILNGESYGWCDD